jgi:serine/threonine protein kinase
MSIKKDDGICPICGFDEKDFMPALHHLPLRSILNGKYLVGRVLGEGGFGITYLGWDLNLDLKIAVKEFYPSGFVTRENTSTNTVTPFTGDKNEFFQSGREKFVDEAKRLAKFYALPGIVSIKDFFLENGTAYIVMEFIDGETFKQYLTRMGGNIPAEQMFEMIKPLMKSLDEIHRAGIIHRDISPDNIMITKEGYIKLLDFGAARDFGDSGNKSLSVMLKPGYAPEEQYRSKGKQGPWTDIYALCATIYKAITGITPDESSERLRNDELKRPSELGIVINSNQEDALMKGMAVLQEKRFQSIDDLFHALYETKNHETVNSVIKDVPKVPVVEDANRQESDFYVEKEVSSYINHKIKSSIFKIDKFITKKIAIGIVCTVVVFGIISKVFFSQDDNGDRYVDNKTEVLDNSTNSPEISIDSTEEALAVTNEPLAYPEETTSGTEGTAESDGGQESSAVETDSLAEEIFSETASGNTSGNIINGGRIVAQGDWIYYSFYGTLNKMKPDGSEKTELYPVACSSMVIQDDWIYFCNRSDNENLYRIRTDGSQITMLDESESCNNINVVGEWVYCTTWKNGTFKIKTDGSEKIMLPEYIKEMTVIGDWIYFNAFSRMKTDGTQEETFFEDDAYYPNVVDGWVYYSDEEHICKVRTDGSEYTIVYDGIGSDLNVYDDWIYFTVWDEGSKASYFYKIRTDGSELTKLSPVGAYEINVYGDWVYYCNAYELKYYQLKTDNSVNKLVEE